MIEYIKEKLKMKTRRPSINHTEPRPIDPNHADPDVDVVSVPEEGAVIVTDKGNEFTVGEIRHSSRIIKSATPKGDLSWYIKWISSIIVLIAVTIRASGIPELHWVDVALSWVGAMGWFVVGFMWKDRALILLNGVIGVILFSGLLKLMFGA